MSCNLINNKFHSQTNGCSICHNKMKQKNKRTDFRTHSEV